MATSVIVDDTDPRITYNPLSAWYVGGVSNEYNGTAHGTDTAGATATITFNATSIAVYGTIDITTDTNHPYDPASMYIIDGGPPTYYQGIRSQQIIQYRVLYFQSPDLPAGEHTLLINSTVQLGYYNIDYLLLQYSNATNATTSATTTSTSTSNPSSTGASSSRSTNVSTGAVAGGAVGGVVFLLLLFFLAWRFRRKSKARALASAEQPPILFPIESPQAEVTPFFQSPIHPSSSSASMKNRQPGTPVGTSQGPSSDAHFHQGMRTSSSNLTSLGASSDAYYHQGVRPEPAFVSNHEDYGAPPSYHDGIP